ncbi:nucleotide disphospho-sugar-binding domain-containing protein [Kitasatospora sp. NPDC059673]|uniref:nucleotide disphospho-sugar-binding domain-containing protein n=1 Tax=Kitasatospora sp. NPDC059673 TaxID=3346901 RepID=UPI0036D0C48C
MRVLVMASPVPTHLLPLLPVAWAARAAGHEVLVAGQPDLVEAARGGGLSIAVVGHEQREIEERRQRRMLGQADPGGDGGARREPPWKSLADRWRARVEDVLPDVLRIAERWRPDVVLADPLEYASLIVGGVRGIPVVHHRWGVDSFTSRDFDRIQQALAGICQDHGLPGLPGPDLVLDPCPPSLQHPDAAPAHPVRFVPSNGVGLRPDWAPKPAGTRRICVSLGLRTLALEGPAVIAAALRGLGSLPGVQTVATVPAEHRAGLGALPASVRLVDPTPLDLFLDGCDAVVHHGGSGTGLAAIARGLPQLVLPQTPWTAEHAERVTALGVGLSLPAEEQQRDPAAVAGAVARLLDEPAFRAATARLRAELHAMPTPADAVTALAALAG